MNWGKGIVLGMIIFILFIVGMSICMFMAPTDDYDHQYYEKGLSFDRDYDKEKQVYKDKAQPVIVVDPQAVKLTFTAPAHGTITFVRPSDNKLDKKEKLESSTGNVAEYNTAAFAKGKWGLVIEWVSNKKAYLYQHEIYIK